MVGVWIIFEIAAKYVPSAGSGKKYLHSFACWQLFLPLLFGLLPGSGRDAGQSIPSYVLASKKQEKTYLVLGGGSCVRKIIPIRATRR